MSEIRSLGRGLSALLGDLSDEDNPTHQIQASHLMDVDALQASSVQPRKTFDREKLDSLAASIVQRGVLQPLLVRAKDDFFEIIAGERRWRAARLAGLQKVPVILVDYSDLEALEVALIENLQRDDLNPIEEAESFIRLFEDHARTQEEVASALGKSRSYIANTMRLLQLPPDVQDLVRLKKISAGHARTLIGQNNPMQQAHEIMDKGLSVRQAEDLKKFQPNSKSRKPVEGLMHDGIGMDLALIQGELARITGAKTTVRASRYGLEFRFFYDDMSRADQFITLLQSGDMT